MKRELEIVNLLKRENLGILFLVETDSVQILEQKDYTLSGFQTFFHAKKNCKDKTRMILFVETILFVSKVRITINYVKIL